MRMTLYIRLQVISCAQHEGMALFGQVWPLRKPSSSYSCCMGCGYLHSWHHTNVNAVKCRKLATTKRSSCQGLNRGLLWCGVSGVLFGL